MFRGGGEMSSVSVNTPDFPRNRGDGITERRIFRRQIGHGVLRASDSSAEMMPRRGVVKTKNRPFSDRPRDQLKNFSAQFIQRTAHPQPGALHHVRVNLRGRHVLVAE